MSPFSRLDSPRSHVVPDIVQKILHGQKPLHILGHRWDIMWVRALVFLVLKGLFL